MKLSDGFYLDYTVNAIYSGSQQSKAERFKMYGRNEKSAIVSPNYNIYQDDSMVVSIMKEQNTVFVAHRPNTPTAAKQVENMFQAQDTLLNSMDDIACSQVQENGKTLSKYVIKPNLSIRKKYKISHYEIWVETGATTMKRSLIHYASGPLKTYEIIIHEYKDQYSQSVFEGAARNIVFAQNGLKPKYKNYKLVDATKFKSNTADAN